MTNRVVRGSMGLGSLLVLIAFILVAMIFSMVMLNTNAMLRDQSIETATLTKDALTQNLVIKEVSATDGLTGSVDQFRAIVKLMPGSDDVRLDRMVITLSKFNQTLSLNYKNGSCTPNQTTGYYTIK